MPMLKGFHMVMRDPFDGRHLTLLTLLATLATGGVISWTLVEQDAEARRQASQGVAREWAANLEVELRHSLSVLDVMATMVRQGQGEIDRFQELAPHFFSNYPAVLDLEMQKDGIIADVYPREGNEGAIGVNLWESDADVELLKAIRDSGELTVQGPIKLFQGPFEGLVARQPLYFDHPGEPHRFWGFVTAIFRLDKLIDQAGFKDLADKGYHYELRGIYSVTGSDRVISGAGDARFADAVSSAINLPGGDWSLHLERIGGWYNPALIRLGALFTLLFGGLTTSVVHYSRAVRWGAKRAGELNAALRERNERIQKLLEAVPTGLVIVDGNGCIETANESALRTFGYTREEMLGQSVQMLVPERLRGRHTDQLQQYLSHPSRRKMVTGDREVMGCRKDGGDFPVDIALNPLRVPGSGEMLVVASIVDITERKRARHKLEEAQGHAEKKADFEAALNNLLRCSLRAASVTELFECSLDVILAQSFLKVESRAGAFLAEAENGPLRLMVSRDLSPELETLCDSVPFGTCLCGRAAQCGEIVHAACVDERHEIRFTGMQPHGHYSVPILGEEGVLGVIVFYLPDGARCREEELAFLRAASEVVAIGLQRLAAEDGLRKAVSVADQANRAKSEFLSRMSHELRTPLNGILGFSQLLQMARLPEREDNNVKRIHEAGSHLLDLINEVLDISRIESGDLNLSPEGVNAAELVSEVIGLAEPLARKKNITLRADDGNVPGLRVMADRQRLRQVLLNLASNAIKYNRDNGSVTFSITHANHDRVRIEVSDTGIGIPEKKLARLFIPFDRLDAERTHTEIEGTGLGLALTKKLIDAMGGQISVVSHINEGSVFALELGRTEVSDHLHRAQKQILPKSEAGKNESSALTVLCIEDNPDNLSLVEQVVEHGPGVRLLSAIQGGQGLDLAREHRPDLIFLDFHLPDLNGDDVLQRLKSDDLTRDIPVYMLSADAMSDQIERLKKLGATDYLTKPLDIERFLKLLASHAK